MADQMFFDLLAYNGFTLSHAKITKEVASTTSTLQKKKGYLITSRFTNPWIACMISYDFY